ncbi:RICIN domain-containing protein [Bacteroides cellulosilyticus]|uniref:RICIN domain-containing protein n=1 Tax=Bacteroides cellulosilyticus TaxID=246787 RepID=UPI0032C01844
MKTKFNRNRNIMIFAIYLLFAYIGNITSQISVPKPSIHLAFDTSNPAYETISGHLGTLTGTFSQSIDRFGNEARSVWFLDRGSGIRLAGFDINTVHTVSVWYYNVHPFVIPPGPEPFEPTDVNTEFYNWTDRLNNVLKGVGRKKATIGFNRFITKPGGKTVSWYLWAYKPAQFDQIGWYHIFVVHGMYYTRLIMYKPDTTKAYSYIWMGDQGFPTNKYLYVGGFDDYYPVNGALDDFKVYNAELTDAQIDFLHTAEYPKDVYVRIQNKNSGKYALVYNAEIGNLSLIAQGSTGIGNDEWKLSFFGTNECKIQNLHSRRFIVVKDASTAIGAEIVQYDEKGTDNEFWILDYSDIDTKYFRLKNKKSGKYLGVYQNSKLDNYKLIQVNGEENSVYWTFLQSYPNEKSKIDYGLYRIKNKKSGLYLTVKNRSLENYDSIVQHRRFDMDDETVGFDTWLIESASRDRNAYSLRNLGSGYYLTDRFSDSEEEVLHQKDYWATGEMDWQFLSTGVPGEYRMRNSLSYYYAVVKNASTEDNANIIKYHSGPGDNEIWILERVYYSDSPLPKSIYKIRNKNSLKLMVVKDASTADDAKVIQYSTGTKNSEWEIVPAPFGLVQLRNINSQKFLVVKDASLEIGEELIQHGASTFNSYWKITKDFYMESGVKEVVYTLKNLRSGLYAVVKDASIADGTSIIQYDSGEKNMLWTFSAQQSGLSYSALDLKRTEIPADLNRPEVMVDCKNDIILLDYPFETATELIVKIMDLTGRLMYEGKRNADGGNNVITISQFNSALNANQLYVVTIRSIDGKVNCSVKTIMSK